MGSSKTFNDNSLFSDMEQTRLHKFLDCLESKTDSGVPLNNTNQPTPILLSSPYQLGTTDATKAPYYNNNNNNNNNSIHINTLILPPSDSKNIKKKYQSKRMTPYSPTSSSSTVTSSSDEFKKTRKSNKKMPHELLSDRQKKANHIASEQKRRANIRIGFEKLVDVVPTLSSGHRSEALILQKSVDHLRQLIDSKTKLKERARELQLMLGDIPDDDSSEGEDYDF